MVMGDGIGIKNLELALARWTVPAFDAGLATGGGNTTADDTRKDWPVNVWAGGRIKIIKANGQEYDRAITANTATQVTFAALPGGVVVAAGDFYAVKGSAGIAAAVDITDRWNRQLGQIDLQRVLGAALAHGNPVIVRLTDGAAFIAPATQATLALVLAQLDVALSTRASQATVASILAQLDVALSTRATEATLAKTVPIAKAAIFNTALPAAEADWLGAPIAPTNSPSFLRLYVAVAAAGIFRVTRTVGGVTVVENMNGAVGALAANAGYIFDVEWRSGDTLNFRYSVTGANILCFRADEVGAAV